MRRRGSFRIFSADDIHSFEEGSNITGDVVDLAEVVKKLVIVENLTEKKERKEEERRRRPCR